MEVNNEHLTVQHYLKDMGYLELRLFGGYRTPPLPKSIKLLAPTSQGEFEPLQSIYQCCS